MAGRPTKQGLDYFPMSTDFFSDLKVRKIARACGPQSTSILICLLCNIYRKDGYYILWNEDLPFDIADTVGVSEGAVKEVITKAIKVGFLDAEKFSVHGVLTSAGIQKRFFAATYRRDEIRVIPEYIIPNGDIPIFDSNNSINAGNNSISASNNSINAGNNSINAVRNSTDALGTRENRPKTGENPPTEDGFPIFTSNNSIFASNNSIFASNNSINDSSNEQSKVNKSKEKNNISPPYNPPPLGGGDREGGEAKADKAKADKIDYKALMQTFNGMFAGKIPQITAVTEKRRKAVKARIAEHGKEAVMTVFRNILQSPFLLGRNDNGWTADFDWIFKPTNFIKILEENYNNGNQRGKYQQDAEQRKLDSAIAIATTVRDAAAKRRKELEAEGVIDPLQRT